MTLDLNTKRAEDPELDLTEEDEGERADEDVRVAGGLCRLDAPVSTTRDDG